MAVSGGRATSPEKILMIIGQFHPCIGGAEQECRNLSEKFISLGHAVSVLTQYQDGLPPFELVGNVPVYRKIRGWHLFEFTYMLSVFIFLLRHRDTFDHILCFGLYLYTAPAVVFALCTGKKVFFRLEGSGASGDFCRVSRLRTRRMVLGLAKWAHRCIAISSAIAQELVDKGFSGRKIVRIPNSVDTERFMPRTAAGDPGAARIMFVGRLSEEKGPDIFLQALKMLMDKGVACTACIAGDGPDRQELMKRAEELSLSGVLTFAGLQPDTAPLYREADMLVLPSRHEGLPLVLLEAMASGLPVIAAAVGGIPDVIAPAGMPKTAASDYTLCAHGLMVSSENVPALALAMERLSGDAALRSRLGSAGRKHVEDLYCLDSIAQQYLDIMGAQ